MLCKGDCFKSYPKMTKKELEEFRRKWMEAMMESSREGIKIYTVEQEGKGMDREKETD